jgi:hypothetical protein
MGVKVVGPLCALAISGPPRGVLTPTVARERTTHSTLLSSAMIADYVFEQEGV